jgi:hypothetical protein
MEDGRPRPPRDAIETNRAGTVEKQPRSGTRANSSGNIDLTQSLCDNPPITAWAACVAELPVRTF